MWTECMSMITYFDVTFANAPPKSAVAVGSRWVNDLHDIVHVVPPHPYILTRYAQLMENGTWYRTKCVITICMSKLHNISLLLSSRTLTLGQQWPFRLWGDIIFKLCSFNHKQLKLQNVNTLWQIAFGWTVSSL